ncbi:aminoglycoside phosphotransferase family protein [Pseudonocardia spirodelae]|uniref:Aminoglycoside phosphotransferase family protein n=1 Tax=Pseudonocardia spirodelae TaxID=3133431 RepID=A0ABU8T9L1_9PSEU
MPGPHRDDLAATVTAQWGGRGAAWLAGLDRLVTGLACELNLELGPALPQSFHAVRAVTCADGTAAVLKAGVPDGHLDAEVAALRAWNGRGAVRLLWSDPARGVLLLERAVPGTEAAAVPDDTALDTIGSLLATLHTAPVPAGLDPVSCERAAFDAHLARRDEVLPRTLVERAAALWTGLCAGAEREVLLHGDLHHHNVLAATREPWLAIDPHGRVGDPGYDCGQVLYNPLGADPDDLARRAPDRLARLAGAVGVPWDRAVAWGFAVCVLSEVWDADGDPSWAGPGTALAVARRLAPLVAD